MHPVLLSFAIYATAVLIGALVLAVRHVRGAGRPMPVGLGTDVEQRPRRPLRLQPWMDLDGSARRQRRRLTPLH